MDTIRFDSEKPTWVSCFGRQQRTVSDKNTQMNNVQQREGEKELKMQWTLFHFFFVFVARMCWTHQWNIYHATHVNGSVDGVNRLCSVCRLGECAGCTDVSNGAECTTNANFIFLNWKERCYQRDQCPVAKSKWVYKISREIASTCQLTYMLNEKSLKMIYLSVKKYTFFSLSFHVFSVSSLIQISVALLWLPLLRLLLLLSNERLWDWWQKNIHIQFDVVNVFASIYSK